jgi:hypothetical protein
VRHPYRTTVLVVAAVVFLTGCSWSQTFTLFLTVRNAEDGQPVPGAAVKLDTLGSEERKDEHDYGVGPGGQTGPDGRFEHDFRISGYTESGSERWYLKVKKDGFEPQVINIRPANQPRKPDEKIPLRVEVRLRPVK